MSERILYGGMEEGGPAAPLNMKQKLDLLEKDYTYINE